MKRFIGSLTLVLRVASIALLLVAGVSPAAAMASPAAPNTGVEGMFVDSDNDGIGDSVDPDDNNDGISDLEEAVGTDDGTSEPPGDADGDGITNNIDPDDNNNATFDRDEPETSSPSNGGEPQGPGGATGSQSRSGSGASSAMIQALPVTGAGSGDGANTMATIAGALACLGLLARRTAAHPERTTARV